MRAALLALALLLASAPAGAAESLDQTTESGPVGVTLRLEPREPVIGDPLNLVIEVRAEPGVELLMPEFGEALDRFSIVDFAPSESLDDEGRTVARQRYTLQPSRSGPQSIPPLLVEFIDRRPGQTPAPEGEDAYELLTERLDFEVASVLPDAAPLELRPARGELAPLAEPGPPLWPIVLVALAVTGALAPFAVRAWLAHRARARRRSASEVARAELSELLAGPRPRDAGEMDAFFVQLSGIVRRYVENRFGLRSPELTTEEFLEVMVTAPELKDEHRGLLRSFLARADLVKFAHFLPDAAAVEESVRGAQRFLDETREDAPFFPDVPAEAARV
jgi:hypothetical protein